MYKRQVIGFVNYLHDGGLGLYVLAGGLAVLLVMVFGWFGEVIRESQAGMNSEQMDRSYRWGMGWFIFSEVMFFAAFFGALYYAGCSPCPGWRAHTTT